MDEVLEILKDFDINVIYMNVNDIYNDITVRDYVRPFSMKINSLLFHLQGKDFYYEFIDKIINDSRIKKIVLYLFHIETYQIVKYLDNKDAINKFFDKDVCSYLQNKIPNKDSINKGISFQFKYFPNNLDLNYFINSCNLRFDNLNEVDSYCVILEKVMDLWNHPERFSIVFKLFPGSVANRLMELLKVNINEISISSECDFTFPDKWYLFLSNFDYKFINKVIVDNPFKENIDLNILLDYLYEGRISSFSNEFFNKDNYYLLNKLDNDLKYNILKRMDFSLFNKIPDEVIKSVVSLEDSYQYRVIMYKLEPFVTSIDVDAMRRNKVKRDIRMYNINDKIRINHVNIYNDLFYNPLNIIKYKYYFSKDCYDKLIKNLDIKDKVDRNKKLYKFFNDLAITNLDKDIFDSLFGDFMYNVKININEMLRYPKTKDIIGEDYYNLYRRLYSFSMMDTNSKIKLYDELRKINIKDIFYDHISMIKRDSYNNLISSCLKLDKSMSIYKKDESERNGVDIYKLEGEPFYALVRCVNCQLHYDKISKDDLKHNNSDGYSFSIISNKNIRTFKEANERLTLLFSNDDASSIVHVYHTDSFSKYDREKCDYATTCVNEIHTVNSLMDRTRAFNEIVINTNPSMKPIAYICYDRANYFDIETAKTLELPILVIDRRRYYKSPLIMDQQDYPKYIYDYHFMEGVNEYESFRL